MSKSAKCVILLMIISAIVYIGLVVGMNMWLVICLYWLVLTIKNVIDAKDATNRRDKE